MVVNVVECLTGARKAKGLVVIIDVFRSGTVECFAVDQGVNELYAVDSFDQAKALAAEKGGKVIGEKSDVDMADFDFTNSPTLLEESDVAGAVMVHTTNSGTRGLVACPEADEVIAGTFVNAGAVVRYIQSREPEVVTLVAIGTEGIIRAQEDMMCAMYIKNELEDYPNSFKTLKSFLANVDSSEKFFDENRPDSPESDFEKCMDLDRFDFVLRAEPVSDGCVRLNKVTVEAPVTA